MLILSLIYIVGDIHDDLLYLFGRERALPTGGASIAYTKELRYDPNKQLAATP